MDFTYIFAGLLGLAVGFATAIVLLLLKRASFRRALPIATVITLLLDALLLINWSSLGQVTAPFVIFDFGMIAVFTLIGCAVGSAPPLLFQAAWAAIRRNSQS